MAKGLDWRRASRNKRNETSILDEEDRYRKANQAYWEHYDRNKRRKEAKRKANKKRRRGRVQANV